VPNASKKGALAAWRANAPQRPHDEILLACVSSYRAYLAEKTRREGRPALQCFPETWLNGHRWDTFIETAHRDQSQLENILRHWNGRGAAAAAVVGEAVFTSWFKESRLIEGPPPVILVPTRLQCDRIRERYAEKLQPLLGENLSVELSGGAPNP